MEVEKHERERRDELTRHFDFFSRRFMNDIEHLKHSFISAIDYKAHLHI
jgi:hypothetical protein